MNERIKDFLDEATEIHDDRNTGVSYPVVDYKIFAELIIRECATACDSVAEEADAMKDSKYVSEYGRMLHEGMWGGAQNCKVEILNRFEIE